MSQRSGTVCLLGAGASRDAGYPLADELQCEVREEFLRDQTATALPSSTFQLANGVFYRQVELFDFLWSAYCRALQNAPDAAELVGNPNLEGMFAFYETAERLNGVFAQQNDPQTLPLARKKLRRFRETAFEVTQRLLSPAQKRPAGYLARLFELRGPRDSHHPVIATLNFDMSLEREAYERGITFNDGFERFEVSMPEVWRVPELRELAMRWEHVDSVGRDFVGVKSGSMSLLKLHGSLGWFVLEEGPGSIAASERQRHNVAYRYFRVDHQRLLATPSLNDAAVLALPSHLSVKAGSVFIRPWMMFARGYKYYPEPPTLELLSAFERALEGAKYMLVIGYSWSDAHVNDALLRALAKGAHLVNVGWQPLTAPELAIWRDKLPTVFPHLGGRIFAFHGGAKRCLTGTLLIQDRSEVRLDLVAALNTNSVPIEFALNTSE
jgi:hypothetical protein